MNHAELRIGLGCMRLPAERAAETIAAAAGAGITLFDTARAYNDSERLLADALRECLGPAAATARIVTKGGMSRPEGAWIPDGRAKTILADCEASLAALDGLPIDTFLIHSPDPRTPWRTSVRALARVRDEGLAQRIGLSNVNRTQLDEAVELAPIAAVQVSLSVFDDRAVRGGLLARCAELRIDLIAHSPLGGPRRARSLARLEALAELAGAKGATPAQIALAWLLGLGPHVLAIPGATHPDHARSAAGAARLTLTAADRAALEAPHPRRARPARSGDVVVVMGIPGAGKSRIAESYRVRGYARLNRDVRGDRSLRDLAGALDAELAAGARRVVLDNTYLTRAARSYVVDAAARHGLPARCVWLNTPLAQAQVNLVERLLDQFGHLPMPEELRDRARRTQGILTPTSQMRAVRELEPPGPDEGFAGVEVVAFTRTPTPGRPGVFIAAAALARLDGERAPAAAYASAPHLVFDWSTDVPVEVLDPLVAQLEASVGGPVAAAMCPHGGGPPKCWCRPPLPGLPLAFARQHRVDPSRSMLIGTGPAHRTLATALGAGYVEVP